MSGALAEYSVREVNQETARVIREVAESGQPAVVTRRGRPAFLIVPVPGDVRDRAVAAAVAAELAGASQGGAGQ